MTNDYNDYFLRRLRSVLLGEGDAPGVAPTSLSTGDATGVGAAPGTGLGGLTAATAKARDRPLTDPLDPSGGPMPNSPRREPDPDQEELGTPHGPGGIDAISGQGGVPFPIPGAGVGASEAGGTQGAGWAGYHGETPTYFGSVGAGEGASAGTGAGAGAAGAGAAGVSAAGPSATGAAGAGTAAGAGAAGTGTAAAAQPSIWGPIISGVLGAAGSYLSANAANKPRTGYTNQTTTQTPYMADATRPDVEAILNGWRNLINQGPAYVGNPRSWPQYTNPSQNAAPPPMERTDERAARLAQQAQQGGQGAQGSQGQIDPSSVNWLPILRAIMMGNQGA